MQNIPFMTDLPCGLRVLTCLDVSTAHIHPKDCRLLAWSASPSMGSSFNGCLSPDRIIVYLKDSGFFVHVCQDFANEYKEIFKNAGYSKAFLRIFQEALDAGTSWICFDADGSVSERLPVLPHE